MEKEYAVFKNGENGKESAFSVESLGQIPIWRDRNFVRTVTLQQAIRLKQRAEKVFSVSGNDFASRRMRYWESIIALNRFLGDVLKMKSAWAISSEKTMRRIVDSTPKIVNGDTHVVARIPYTSNLVIAEIPRWIQRPYDFVKKSEMGIIKAKMAAIKSGGEIVIKTIYAEIRMVYTAAHGFIIRGKLNLTTKSPSALKLLRYANDKLINAPSMWRIVKAPTAQCHRHQ
jgi:hypothetical protein